MINKSESILSAIRAFYPTYDVGLLSSQKNSLGIANYLANDELPEGVIFAKRADNFKEVGLWATNKRLLEVSFDKQSKSQAANGSAYEHVIFVSAGKEQIVVVSDTTSVAYGSVDKKAQITEFAELVQGKVSVASEQMKVAKWQYLLIGEDDGKFYLNGNLVPGTTWLYLANQLGVHGWELVTTLYTPSGATWGVKRYLFKRAMA